MWLQRRRSANPPRDVAVLQVRDQSTRIHILHVGDSNMTDFISICCS
jgi:hypothetical protein